MADPTTAAKVTTAYVFLYRTADAEDWKLLRDDNGDEYVGHSRGSEQAVRDVVKTHKDLGDIVESVGAEIWPVPQRSRQIFPARMVRPEPVVKIG